MATPVSIIYVSEFFVSPLRCGFPILNIPILDIINYFLLGDQEGRMGDLFFYGMKRGNRILGERPERYVGQ